ncbi:MAG TPA: regulatory protein RecX [Panacibacter sp.]|nr:regulatory protein RecX [Panacibacter sp.]HNP44140.1 regulatory protein RecX [Panacibacter sp.]
MDDYNKIKRFCAIQERSHAEIREKLYRYGLFKKDVEKILAELIGEGYINEERFAHHYAGGKFRMKKWGRVKIRYCLKKQGVSSANINDAIDEISEEDYLKALNRLAEKKWLLLSKENLLVRKSKAIQYLLQKGYERPLAVKAVEKAATAEKA